MKFMKNAKKISNSNFILLLIAFAFYTNSKAEIYKTQFIPPQKETRVEKIDPGKGILSMYSMTLLSLNSYNRLREKCSPYFPENELERNEANKARKMVADLKVCYQRKTGKVITDQMIRDARDQSNTGGIDLNTIAMVDQMNGAAVNPRSPKDAKMCSEKAGILTLSMIPLKFTEFPKSGWCNELK